MSFATIWIKKNAEALELRRSQKDLGLSKPNLDLGSSASRRRSSLRACPTRQDGILGRYGVGSRL